MAQPKWNIERDDGSGWRVSLQGAAGAAGVAIGGFDTRADAEDFIIRLVAESAKAAMQLEAKKGMA